MSEVVRHAARLDRLPVGAVVRSRELVHHHKTSTRGWGGLTADEVLAEGGGEVELVDAATVGLQVALQLPVNLTETSVDALERRIAAEGLNASTVINRALQVYDAVCTIEEGAAAYELRLGPLLLARIYAGERRGARLARWGFRRTDAPLRGTVTIKVGTASTVVRVAE